jgi:O-antigen/teichoic acid export membrane protein
MRDSDPTQKAAKGGFSDKAILVASGSAIQAAGNAVIGILLTRLLPDSAAVGSYKQAWLVMNTALPFFLLGLPHAIYYFIPSMERERMRHYVMRCFSLLFISSFIFSVLLYLFASQIAGLFDNPGLAPIIQGFSLYPLFTAPTLLLFPLFITTGSHRRGVVINLCFYLAQSLLIIILIATGFTLSTLFKILVVFALVRLGFFYLQIRKQTAAGNYRDSSVSMRRTLGYSIPVNLGTIATILGQKLDKIVVSTSLGPSIYGIYAFGAVEFPGTQLVSVASNTVMRARIAELHHAGERREILDFWRRSFRKQSLAIVPMTVFLIIFAREFIEFLYTTKFGPAAPVFQIYLAVTALRMFNYVVVLNSVGLSKTVLYGTVVFLVANLVLNLLLIGPMGMMGPPLATLAAVIGITLFYALRVAKYLQYSNYEMFPLRSLANPVFLSAISAAGALAARLFELGNFLTLLTGGLLFAAIYVVAGVKTRIIRADDLEMIKHWMRLGFLRG